MIKVSAQALIMPRKAEEESAFKFVHGRILSFKMIVLMNDFSFSESVVRRLPQAICHLYFYIRKAARNMASYQSSQMI